MSGHPPAGHEASETTLQWRRLLVAGAVACACGLGLALIYRFSPGVFLKGGFSLSTSFGKAGKRPSGASQNHFYIEPLIMNARDADASAFMRLTLTLELERPDVADDVRLRLAAIENIVIVTAASQDAAILRSVEGKARLRDVLTKKINALLPNGGVRSVYFADFLIR